MSNLELEHENEVLKLKLRKLELLKKKDEENARFKREFPWLYLHKLYQWQREVINCEAKKQILVASNQSGKSTCGVIKTIEWATNKELWPRLFPQSYATQGFPRAFWYLYPSLKIATSEFEEKWKPLMPPIDHPVNGWEVKYRGRDVDYVKFKCGTYVRFKTYMQNVHLLQGSSIDLCVADEEVPVEVLPELQMRVQATNGYMLFVFTATRGQTFWRKVVEERSEWKDAAIWQVTLYDCQKFEDGSESQWTNRRISQAIANCTSDAQVQRRIFGRFIRDEGLRFEVWDRTRNTMEYETLSPEWKYYVGVDYGSGGSGGHPSAIAITAVNADMTQARIVGMWRGDKTTTTAEDVVNKLQEMTAYIKDDDLIWCRYDYSAVDIGTISLRRGLAKVQKADKSRDAGLATIQSLLKNGALKICTYNDKAMLAGIAENHMETYKLIEEFENLGIDDSKTLAEDDCCFIAGTKVLTPSGAVAIELLKPNDLVMTSFGPRKINKTYKRKASVRAYKFSDNLWLCATKNHPIATLNRSWVPLGELTPSDTCFRANPLWSQNQSNLTELLIADTHVQSSARIESITQLMWVIVRTDLQRFTEINGFILRGQFLTGIMFTIKTVILLTMNSIILSLYLLANTSHTMVKSCIKILNITNVLSFIWKKLENLQKSGMHLMRVINGIPIIGKVVSARLSKKRLPSHVRSVENYLPIQPLQNNQDFVQMHVGQLHAGIPVWTMWNDLVSIVKKSSLLGNILNSVFVPNHAVTTVYNLEVDEHNQYFANNILVHNCDATRYSLNGIPFDWETIGAIKVNLAPQLVLSESDQRRGLFEAFTGPTDLISEEFDYWNQFMED